MPIIFIHGVNNRNEDADYKQGVARKGQFLRSLLAPCIGLDDAKVLISFPYWGDHGVKFRWNQASVPSGSEDVERLALGILSGGAENSDVWLAEARFQYGEQGVNLRELSKSKDFNTAVDLVWDTAASLMGAGQECAELLESYLASMAYADDYPVPTWVFQSEYLPNEKFVERLLIEIQPYRRTIAGTEALGFGSWFQSLKEAVGRLANLPTDAVSSVVVGLGRKSLHTKASRFLGDVFMYLNNRGTSACPGDIIKDVLTKLREAQAAKRPGDDKLIVIGHSFGGVIMYDVLTHFAPDIAVDDFVTVGSQVALFEEMALYRSSEQEPPTNPKEDRLNCPDNVARWLNVYDTNDLFSFRAAAVFNEVDDYRFDTGYGLLDAHGGYFLRPSFYKRLAARLG
ncbi:hypothetical protein LZP73_06270 [Shewanella sp. AS16]|uniref:hypothetical protein n=1 Tax=Shewanella sp. AS16 TaxID=2907625 RepID=UPI001F2693BD|nr:hypothetical protein [Shewanella sp. AS16]MCE9685822.1 hypothetical protein [Shewanella sp. AS16]